MKLQQFFVGPVCLLLLELAQAQLFLPPPADAESYQQCLVAKTISVNETVTLTISNGAVSYQYDTTNTTARHPQQGAVLRCDNGSNNYYIAPYKNEWYALQGTGNILTASTCHETTEINAYITIYQDECITPACASSYLGGTGEGCPGLCVGSTTTQQQMDCSDNGSSMGTRIAWPSEVDRTYYVQVWQYHDWSFGTIHQLSIPLPDDDLCGGTVTLSVTESPTPTNLDSCQNAISILAGGAPDATTTSANATVVIDQCSTMETSQPGNTKGLWYTVVGSGLVVQVEVGVCGPIVDIYTGTSCGSLTCMNDYALYKSDASCLQTIRFQSVSDERYYFFVSGSNTLNPDFKFIVEDVVVEPAANDHCSGAETLVTDGLTQALSFDGAVHGSQQPDGLFFDTTPSLWYSYKGTGNIITVVICGPVELKLFTGTCVNGTDRYDLTYHPTYEDNCTPFRIASDPTESYLFAIRGFVQDPSAQLVNLTVWEQDIALLPPNADCKNAVGPLAYNNSTISGSLVDATTTGGEPLEDFLFYYANTPAANTFLRGQVCRLSGAATFDISLQETSLDYCTFYYVTQPAGSLVSPIDEIGCVTISWKNEFADSTQPLLIRVSGKEELNFTIAIQEEDDSILPVNDPQPEQYRTDNAGYTTLDIGATMKGSTMNALSDDVEKDFGIDCGVELNKRGVWYAITGAGQDLAVCLVGANNSTTAKLAILGEVMEFDYFFVGCLPDAIYGYSDECPISVRWPTAEGSLYSLLVQTDEPEEFELSLVNVTDGTMVQGCVDATLPPVFWPPPPQMYVVAQPTPIISPAPQAAPSPPAGAPAPSAQQPAPSVASSNAALLPPASAGVSRSAGLFWISSLVGCLAFLLKYDESIS